MRLAPCSMTVLPRVIPARNDSQSTGRSFLSAITIPACLQEQTAGNRYFAPGSVPGSMASPPWHHPRTSQDEALPQPSHGTQMIILPIKYDQKRKDAAGSITARQPSLLPSLRGNAARGCGKSLSPAAPRLRGSSRRSLKRAGNTARSNTGTR